MKFTEFCNKKNSILSERRHFMRHSVERGVEFPVPQSVINALNLIPNNLHAKVLRWIFTEGLRQSLIKRREFAKGVSKFLSDKTGQKVEVPQDGLFSKQAQKEIPGLAEWIGVFENKWMEKHEPDTIQLPGSESGGNNLTSISLKDINAYLINQGLTPLYFGGANGLIEYIEKGDWKLDRGDIPTHANPVFEKHGINLALDDDYNGLKKDENGKFVYSFGLDPSHGKTRKKEHGISKEEFIRMIDPSQTQENKWDLKKWEPEFPSLNASNIDKLTLAVMERNGEKKILKKEIADDGQQYWFEPKAANHTGSYQMPSTEAHWARRIDNSRNLSLTALERVVKGLQEGKTLEELKMSDSETLRILLADGSLNKKSFVSEKALLRDVIRLGKELGGVKVASGSDEDWIAAKAIVKKNILHALKQPGNINPIDGKRLDKASPYAFGDAPSMPRASIKINGRSGIDLSPHLSSGLVQYNGFHGGIDFNSEEFKALEAQLGDVNTSPKMQNAVADALVDLIFNDEDRTIATLAKINRGTGRGKGAKEINLETKQMMPSILKGLAQSHKAILSSANKKPIEGDLMSILQQGWLADVITGTPLNLKDIREKYKQYTPELNDKQNLITFKTKKGPKTYVRSASSPWEVFDVSEIGRLKFNKINLKKGEETMQLQSENGGPWNVVEQKENITVNFNGKPVDVPASELMNRMLSSDKNVFRTKGPTIETMIPVSQKEFDLKAHEGSGWKITLPKGIESFDQVPDNILKIKIELPGVKKKILVRAGVDAPWQEAVPESESSVMEEDIQSLLKKGFQPSFIDAAKTILKLESPEEGSLLFKRKVSPNPQEGESKHQWFLVGTPKETKRENPFVTGLSLKANVGKGITDRIGGTDGETSEMLNKFTQELKRSFETGEESSFGPEEKIINVYGGEYPASLVAGMKSARNHSNVVGATPEDMLSWGIDGLQKYIGDLRFKYGEPKPRANKDPGWNLFDFFQNEGKVGPSDLEKVYQFYLDQLFKKRKTAKVYNDQTKLKTQEIGQSGDFLFGIDENDEPVFSKGIYDAIMHHGFKFRKRAANKEIVRQAKASGVSKQRGRGSSGDADEKGQEELIAAVDDSPEEEFWDNENEYEDNGDNDDDNGDDEEKWDYDYGIEDDDEWKPSDEEYDDYDPDLDDLSIEEEPEVGTPTKGGQIGGYESDPEQPIRPRQANQRDMSTLSRGDTRGTLGDDPSGAFATSRDDFLARMKIPYRKPQPIVPKPQLECRDGFRRWLVETGPYDPKISRQQNRTFNVWGSPPEGEVPQKSIDGDVSQKGVKNGRRKKA